MGGAGSAVNECLFKHQVQTRVLNLGIPDDCIPHGTQASQKVLCGLDTIGILNSIENFLKVQNTTSDQISIASS